MCTGKKIMKLRKEKGISQYELANKIKYLNQSQLSKIEKGTRKITDYDLICISKALDVSVETLLKDELH